MAEDIKPTVENIHDLISSVVFGPVKGGIEVATGENAVIAGRTLTPTQRGIQAVLIYLPVAGAIIGKLLKAGSKVASGVHRAEQAGEMVEEVLESGVRIADRAENVAETAKNAIQPGMRAASDAASFAANRLHHPWPKYLGGAVKQKLQSLPKATHDAFHAGLDKILPRQIRGGATEYYRSLSPAEQAANFQKFMEYTKAFDAKHGTNLWDAIVDEATRIQ